MLAALLVAAALAGPRSADDAMAAARAAERAGQPDAERAACAVVIEQAAGTAAAQTCGERLAWLAARTDPDGGLSGLSRLEAARRTAEGRGDALQAVAEDPSVSAVVRVEAGAALAAAELRAGRAEDALARVAGPSEDPALPGPVRERLLRLRARALVALGRVEDARAVEALLVDRPPEVDALARQRRSARLAPVAAGLGLAWGLPALPLAAVGWWRRPRPCPLGLLPLAVFGGGGLLLSGLWEPSVAGPFAGLLALLAALHLLAAGAALALRDRPGWLRGGFSAGAGIATVSLSYLLMQRTGLLPWIGL